MNKTALDRLVRHKLKVSSASDTEQDIIDSVRADVLKDVCLRHPWAFLKRTHETITLSAGDYQKALPQNFLRMLSVSLKDADNVVYPVHSTKLTDFEEDNPDLDDADTRPYMYRVYLDENDKPWIELRPKANGSYTLLLRYIKALREDDINEIPNGMVLFFGIMAALAREADQPMYKGLYESGIAEMWHNDTLDFGDEPVFEIDPAIETYNIYCHSIE
jgi:hypothetical protein